MQGLITTFDVYTMKYTSDDSGGGAVIAPSGTATLKGHLNILNPSQLALEQGLETPVLADVFIRQGPYAPTVVERDQLQIVGPPGHPFLDQRFRVIGVNQAPMHPSDRRRFLRLRVSRVRASRTEALI